MEDISQFLFDLASIPQFVEILVLAQIGILLALLLLDLSGFSSKSHPSKTSTEKAVDKRVRSEGASSQNRSEARPTELRRTESSRIQPQGPETQKSVHQGLGKTRGGILNKLRDAFSSKNAIDQELREELEMILVSSDMSISTANTLLDMTTERLSGSGERSKDAFLESLRDSIVSLLDSTVQTSPSDDASPDAPFVEMLVGVNGVGKTTTCAKLGRLYREQGEKVLLVAADTFRAAAVSQLKEWGSRLNLPVLTGAEGAKPATVVFDGMKKALEENYDRVLIDTAGRLHNRSNLMQELAGIRNAVGKHNGREPDSTLLVVDGSTGQNALVQAREFHSVTPLSGIVVTKLDGSAKGGVVLSIQQELGVPIRAIGIGEAAEDLRPFDPAEFANALLGLGENFSAVGPSHATTRRNRSLEGAGAEPS